MIFTDMQISRYILGKTKQILFQVLSGIIKILYLNNKINRNRSMSAFIEKLSLFPYMTFWRISSQPHVNNKFAGFVSLLLILAFLAITVAKMIEVYQMTTIFATQRAQIQTVPPMINLTTSYSDPNMDQFMFAIKLLSFADGPRFPSFNFQLTLTHGKNTYNKTTGKYSIQSKSYDLQYCTPSHFYKIPDINKNFYDWGLNTHRCLPINQTFEIGGSLDFGDFKYLAVNIKCADTTTCQQRGNSLIFSAFTLNTFVNPMNGSNPFTAYQEKYEMTLRPSQRNRHFLFLNKNTLITDNNLLPLSKESTISSLQTSKHWIANSYPSTAGPNGAFFILYSGTNVIHKRNYLKLLDAFAYLGGIFNALLGAFFFMNASGCFFFEMDLADKLFKNSKLKEITFLTHFKQAVYSILAIYKEPKWQASKYVSELRTDVNNLLDIVYLQRRLQFLEKGMEVLFQKHHLKGLYLAHEVTKEGAETNFKNFELNEKFDEFLSKKSKSAEATEQKLDEEIIQSAKNLKEMKDIKEVKTDCSPNKDLDQNKNGALDYFTSLKLKESIIFNQQIEGQNPQNQSKKKAMKEEDLMALLKLCREAKQKRGDNRSRKIYEKIDSKLRQALQEMLKYQIPSISTSLKL